jgi:hypothetical protein
LGVRPVRYAARFGGDVMGLTRMRDIDSGSECVQDGNETIGGEPGEVGISDAGEIGGGKAGAGLGGAEGEFLTVEGFDDFGCEQCFQLLDIRIFAAEVPEDVPAAA